MNAVSAVVTGAAKGIGRAVAARLLGEGVAVAGVDLDTAALKATAGEFPGLVTIEGDIADCHTHERAARRDRALLGLSAVERRDPLSVRFL